MATATKAQTNGKPKSLAEALVAVQLEAPQIPLDSTNPHFRSRYVSLAGVMEKVLPVTAKHGLAIVQLPTTLDGSPALTTKLVHVCGESVESTMLLLPAKPDPQGQGSALTYARRYMVLAMLGLVGDEDDDANSASGRPNGAKATATAHPRQSSERPASAKQKGLIHALSEKAGLSKAQQTALIQWTGGVAQLDRLPMKKASELIKAMGEDGSGVPAILESLNVAVKAGDERAQKIATKYLEAENA